MAPSKRPPAKRAPAKRATATAARGRPTAKGRSKGATKAKPASRQHRRRGNDRRALIIRLVAGATVLLFGGGLLYSAASSTGGSTTSTKDELQAGPGQCRYAETVKGDPPVSGEASADAARPGYYQPGDKVPSDAALVKAERQGFVVLWYRPALTSAALGRQQLDKLSNDFGRALILVPRASLTGDVTMTAWQRRLACQSMDPAALSLFASTYTDRGPEHGFL